MRIIISTVVVFLLLASTAPGEVTVTNILVSRFTAPVGTNTFTVPAGKSLYVEHISLGQTDFYVVQYFIVGGLEGVAVLARSQSDPAGQIVSFAPSIKLAAGTKIGVMSNYVGVAMVYGLLVDHADVYAAIPSEFQSEHLTAAGVIQGTLALSSPRPATVKMEASTDLQTWFDDHLNIYASRANDPSQWEYSALNPYDRAFIRARARARKAQ